MQRDTKNIKFHIIICLTPSRSRLLYSPSIYIPVNFFLICFIVVCFLFYKRIHTLLEVYIYIHISICFIYAL